MGRNICIYQDFLTWELRETIQKTAQDYGFTPQFFEEEQFEAAVQALQDCEILYANSLPLLRRKSSALRWYCSSSAGVDMYCNDPQLSADRTFIMTNSTGSYGITIAEHTVMVLLMMMRRMPEFQDGIREKKWSPPLPIDSIIGNCFTILGTGNIGATIAARLKALGANSVIGVNRSGKFDGNDFDEIHPFSGLDAVLQQAGVLIMALPSTAETTHIMDRRRLALLPEGAYLVNVGRGTAIDQSALVDALNSGHLSGAALDVTDPEPLEQSDPLWNAKNLLLTPHVSGNMTLKYTRNLSVEIFCRNIAHYAKGEPMEHVVDWTRGY